MVDMIKGWWTFSWLGELSGLIFCVDKVDLLRSARRPVLRHRQAAFPPLGTYLRLLECRRLRTLDNSVDTDATSGSR
jgi:hypothetical protein